MMRDIHFGIKLPFESEQDRDDSEEILMRFLGLVSRINLRYRKRNPTTPRLYDSKVVYAIPDQLARPAPDKAKLVKLGNMLRDMDVDDDSLAMILRIVNGIEIFLDIPSLYRRGKGDCNELAPVRIAELWEAGIAASPYLTKRQNDRGGWTYHALVLWPDGSAEDPSLILGMGGAARAADRQEEIRKNIERVQNHIAAAKELLETHPSPPDPALMADKVDMLGLLPKSGAFAKC